MFLLPGLNRRVQCLLNRILIALTNLSALAVGEGTDYTKWCCILAPVLTQSLLVIHSVTQHRLLKIRILPNTKIWCLLTLNLVLDFCLFVFITGTELFISASVRSWPLGDCISQAQNAFIMSFFKQNWALGFPQFNCEKEGERQQRLFYLFNARLRTQDLACAQQAPGRWATAPALEAAFLF